MSNYHIKHLEEYFQVYRKSVQNPEAFWEEIAEEHFVWRAKWDRVLSWISQNRRLNGLRVLSLTLQRTAWTGICLPNQTIRPSYLNPMILKRKHSISHTGNCMKGYAGWRMYSGKME